MRTDDETRIVRIGAVAAMRRNDEATKRAGPMVRCGDAAQADGPRLRPPAKPAARATGSGPRAPAPPEPAWLPPFPGSCRRTSRSRCAWSVRPHWCSQRQRLRGPGDRLPHCRCRRTRHASWQPRRGKAIQTRIRMIVNWIHCRQCGGVWREAGGGRAPPRGPVRSSSPPAAAAAPPGPRPPPGRTAPGGAARGRRRRA